MKKGREGGNREGGEGRERRTEGGKREGREGGEGRETDEQTEEEEREGGGRGRWKRGTEWLMIQLNIGHVSCAFLSTIRENENFRGNVKLRMNKKICLQILAKRLLSPFVVRRSASSTQSLKPYHIHIHIYIYIYIYIDLRQRGETYI